MPKGLPNDEISAPSPPELPPGDNVVLNGFTVRPKIWFSVSNDLLRKRGYVSSRG